MLYSKNGSIPKPQTDGTEGWIEVPDKPRAPKGCEVVWWYPPGWVIREVCPSEPGMKYDWSQSEQMWIATPIEEVLEVIEIDTDIISNTSATEVISTGSAADVITFGSAGDTISGV